MKSTAEHMRSKGNVKLKLIMKKEELEKEAI
jgi:hypothetical protein